MRTVNPVMMLMGMVVLTTATPRTWSQQDQAAAPPLSGAVGKVLEQKAQELQTGLAADPRILQAVRDSNAKNATLAHEEIMKLDKQWMAGGLEGLVRQLVTNPCAQQLVAFQDAHTGYAEVFIADGIGLNVCQTNRTSDYYQADEDWWINSYANGRGKTLYGKIEYDESAMVEAISVFLPIMDPESHKAIGVMKGVVDLTAIKREL